MLRRRDLCICLVLVSACGQTTLRKLTQPPVRDRHGRSAAAEVTGTSSPESTDKLAIGPRLLATGGSGGWGGDANSGGGGGGGDPGGSGGAGGSDGSGVGGGPPLENAIAFQGSGAMLAPDVGDFNGQHLEMGGGMALIDLDGDGDLDLLVTSERRYLRAYRNDGNFEFAEFGPAIGIPFVPFTTAVAVGDCDGDGSLEIFVSRLEVPQLYHRTTSGRWSLVSDSGFDVEQLMGLGATFVDVDGDGDLDIVQAVYHPMHGGGGDVPRIWLNDGSCRFTRSPDAGLLPGESVDVGVFDSDLDGDPDLLVVTDFGIIDGPTRLYQNMGGGSFQSTTPDHGILAGLLGMGAGIGDLDGDGLIDAYVTNIGRNPFFHNLGGGDFRDDSAAMGIGNAWYIDNDVPGEPMPFVDPGATDPGTRATARFVQNYMADRPDTDQAFATTGWSALIADFDADGYNDLFVTNGVAGWGPPEGEHQHTVLFKGGRNGFADVSAQAGLDLVGTHKGAALGDLDGDGLQDLALFDDAHENPMPEHLILRNMSVAGNFFRIDLDGKAPNTWGIGARVEVRAGGTLHVAERTLHSGIYSASADSLFVGVGMATIAESITVYWPWGAGITTVKGVPAGHVHIAQ